jgi:two-component system cell cycle response regulator DivK
MTVTLTLFSPGQLLGFLQQLRQLGDIRRNPPCLRVLEINYGALVDALRQFVHAPAAAPHIRLVLHHQNALAHAVSTCRSTTTGSVKANVENRQIIRDMLAPTDYEITEAENGEEALAAIANQRPDLILMDIQLPVMDGYEATRRIKADVSLRSIPIIAVTSYALSGEGQKARVAGCDDYVPKPFSPRQLLAKIRQYLS